MDVIPGKDKADFRVYEESGGVYEHYKAMRLNQCFEYATSQEKKWREGFGTRVGGRFTVRKALELCDTFVDRSDPDTALPNSIHMLQAAEACRAAGKPDWFQLVALLHDIGKLMYKWGSPEEGQGGKATDPQWGESLCLLAFFFLCNSLSSGWLVLMIMINHSFLCFFTPPPFP